MKIRTVEASSGLQACNVVSNGWHVGIPYRIENMLHLIHSTFQASAHWVWVVHTIHVFPGAFRGVAGLTESLFSSTFK